jgi:DUF4097 and DUF4098 domain-containing protein YvlB
MQWLASLLFASLLASSNGNLPLQTVQVQTQNQTVSQNVGEEIERFEQTYPFNSNGKIKVSNINGSITVEAWEKNEIKLETVKYAESKEWLDELKVRIDASQSLFSVETDFSSWQNRKGGNWGKNGGSLQVEIRLYVPKNAYLDEIETVNGSVNVSNMQNFTKASAVNGQVRAVNLRGSAEISTVNGTTEAEFDSLQSTSKITLSTVNGRVNLTIPSDADATVKADTVNGGIRNDFGLPIKKGEYIGRNLYGKLGNGDVKINLNSVNGPLNINRKKDGREMKAVTNLLPMKDKDDEDCDDCEDSSFISPKMQRDIERVAKNAERAERQAQIAVRQVNEQLKNMNLNVEIQDKFFDESRQNLIEAQQELEESQIALKEAESETEGSKKERDEAIKDANESLKQAQKQLKNAQREFERIQKRGSRLVSPVSPIPPVSPVSPMAPLSPLESYGGDLNYGSATVEKTADIAVVKGTPKVTVNGFDSEVVVNSWDKSEVGYTITKISKNKSDIDFQINKSDSEVSIKAIDNRKPLERGMIVTGTLENRDGKVYLKSTTKIRIELNVPRKSDLKIIGSDGNVRIDGVSGDLDINNSDGKISVRDSNGKLRITNSDGNVRIIGFKGELDAKTSDGDFYLEGEFSRINAKSSDGNFILTLPENANADIQANVEELDTVGISATKKSDEHWQIGNGGAKFTFNVEDGSVKIRGLSQVKN